MYGIQCTNFLFLVQSFSQICGMAIDNACTISDTTKLCNIDNQAEDREPKQVRLHADLTPIS